MKAKVIKVRPSAGRFANANVIEFEVEKEPYVVVIEPGQDVKQRMMEVIKETKRMRRVVSIAADEFKKLKKLEGQEIDLEEEEERPNP